MNITRDTEEQGVSAVEYAIIISMISAVLILVVSVLGGNLSSVFSKVSVQSAAEVITPQAPGGVSLCATPGQEEAWFAEMSATQPAVSLPADGRVDVDPSWVQRMQECGYTAEARTRQMKSTYNWFIIYNADADQVKLTGPTAHLTPKWRRDYYSAEGECFSEDATLVTYENFDFDETGITFTSPVTIPTGVNHESEVAACLAAGWAEARALAGPDGDVWAEITGRTWEPYHEFVVSDGVRTITWSTRSATSGAIAGF